MFDQLWTQNNILYSHFEVKNDHRSKFSNVSNWKEEAWKNQGFNGIRTRDLCDSGAMLYQLSYEATHSERGQFIDLPHNVWLHSSVGRASHRYRRGHGFESRWSLDFFKASSFQLLTLENLLRWSFFTLIYNRSSNMWITSYILHNSHFYL